MLKRLLAAAVAALIVCGPATAAKRPDAWNLHAGSHGPRVSGLQWMLAGHRPNVFREVKGTFPHKPNGLFGKRTGRAVTAMKFRLGYPMRFVKPIAGPYFFALLLGHVKRPPQYVALAAKRVRAIAEAQPTKVALRWKATLVSWLGLSEIPVASNRGPCISYPCVWHGHNYPSIQGATGAYGAAWCVSTQQAAAALAGYGHFADDSASVYYVADYYAARNMLHAKPRFGALVLFIDYDRHGRRIPGTGHMGYVTKVTASGFSYIAGNDGNAVREHYISFGARPYAFAWLPHVTTH